MTSQLSVVVRSFANEWANSAALKGMAGFGGAGRLGVVHDVLAFARLRRAVRFRAETPPITVVGRHQSKILTLDFNVHNSLH